MMGRKRRVCTCRLGRKEKQMGLHTHGLKPDELSFYDRYFSQLVGAKILGFEMTRDEDFEYWPTFVVRLKSGEEITIEISQDEEGNGPGFIFGLEVK
jgi:hypothetical protein